MWSGIMLGEQLRFYAGIFFIALFNNISLPLSIYSSAPSNWVFVGI
jgi:hypothetical protein